MLSSAPVRAPLYSRRISPQRLRQWVGLAAFMVALASLLVFAAGASLWHQDSPGTACPICYATHLPAMRSLPAHTPVAAPANCCSRTQRLIGSTPLLARHRSKSPHVSSRMLGHMRCPSSPGKVQPHVPPML